MRQNAQDRWSLNVWGGILGNFVIGPYFFDGTLTGQNYLLFLQNNLPELLEDVPIQTREQMWLQHDGAPVHNTREVKNYLDNMFPNRWIGRGGPKRWPARSPDLTKMDFFLWGYVKEEVYKMEPTTKEEMKERIKAVFRNINDQMLVNVSASFVSRLGLCIEKNGGHFE